MSETEKPESKPETDAPATEKAAQMPDGFDDDMSPAEKESKARLGTLEKELSDLRTERERLQKERDDLDQKYRSAKGRLKEESKPQHTGKTWEQYEKELATAFDEDPKGVFFRVLRDTAQDLALRDVQYERKLKEAEERAFRRALSLDPERGKMVEKIAQFDEDNPDLAGLSLERKMQFMRMNDSGGGGDNRRKEGRTRDNADDDDPISDLSLGGSDGSGRVKQPGWVSDPDVVKEGRKAFESKREMMLWVTDPDKARELMRQRRQGGNARSA